MKIPGFVLVSSILVIINALVAAGLSYILLAFAGFGTDRSDAIVVLSIVTAGFILALVLIVAAVLMMRGKNWARVTAFTLCILSSIYLVVISSGADGFSPVAIPSVLATIFLLITFFESKSRAYFKPVLSGSPL